MLNCKQVVTIVSTEDSPKWRRNLRVRWHLFICVHCRKYVQHLRLVREAFQKLFKSAPTAEEKQKIKDLEDQAIAKIAPENKQ